MVRLAGHRELPEATQGGRATAVRWGSPAALAIAATPRGTPTVVATATMVATATTVAIRTSHRILTRARSAAWQGRVAQAAAAASILPQALSAGCPAKEMPTT